MRTGPHTSAVTISCVAVSTSISVKNSSLPSRSFHALGNTISDAPVLTKASQVSAFERSTAFSILTVATILPTSMSFASIQVTIHRPKLPAKYVCHLIRDMKDPLREVTIASRLPQPTLSAGSIHRVSSATEMINWDDVRKQFPVTENSTYLNS